MSTSNSRQGKPVVSLTLTADEIELVDAYKRAMGLTSRSKALRELLWFAFGHNQENYALVDNIPNSTRRAEAVQEVRHLSVYLREQRIIG